MACFTASVAEAIIVKAVEKVELKREKNAEISGEASGEIRKVKIPMSRKLHWLHNMLMGGSALLAFEHVWHGEVVAWFPFLTAMSDPNDAAEMFHEMATVGVSMASLITVIWLGMCFVADKIMKRSEDKEVEPETV